MSQENVETVRRLVEAFNSRDDGTVASLLDPKLEFESLTLQNSKGEGALAEYRRNLDDAWAVWRSEADRLLPAGPTGFFTSTA